MTRKDYVLIAAALARTRPHMSSLGPGYGLGPSHEARQWLVTRDAIIGALMLDNPRFDRARFVKATEA